MVNQITEIAVNKAILGVSDDGLDGTAMVLMHGYAGSTADWDGVLESLSLGRRVIAYDHRGHGHSSHTPPYSFAALTDDLLSLLDTLGLDRVDLLGHSMGGVVAQRFALAHPARVRSLLLMDTAARPRRGPLTGVVALLGLVSRIAGMRGIIVALRPLSRLGGDRPQPPPEQRSRQEKAFLAMDPRAFAALGRELGRHTSLVSRLHEITCPTTVIVGEDDKGLRSRADELVDQLPRATLSVIGSAGHTPQTDQPQAWLAAVAAHFERLETP